MSSRPTLTPAVEEQMVKAIQENRGRHITMPAASYRTDGSLMVARDGLSGIRAQRHLYRRLIGELGIGDYLRRKCGEARCVNPYHYTVTTRSRDGVTECPNGHPYTPENTLPDGDRRCRICRDADLERRRDRYARAHPNTLRSPAEVNAEKTECIHGHEFTESNLYIRTSPSGRIQRQCRTCTITRARERAKTLRDERLAAAATPLRKAS